MSNDQAAVFGQEFVERFFNKTRRFRNVEAHLSRAELAALIAVAVLEAQRKSNREDHNGKETGSTKKL